MGIEIADTPDPTTMATDKEQVNVIRKALNLCSTTSQPQVDTTLPVRATMYYFSAHARIFTLAADE